MKGPFGADTRRVEHREFQGKAAVVMISSRAYDTSVDDLWEALTTRERIERWFLPIEGELKVGGRYQLKGNAGGTITQCDKPNALAVTWEFGGGTSWVSVRLTAEGAKTRLTLEHAAHRGDVGEEHFKKFGPGAVGIGWDLSLHGLSLHVASKGAKVDPTQFEAWSTSDEGQAFVRSSGEGWYQADVAGGEVQADARARADRTISFYTGG